MFILFSNKGSMKLSHEFIFNQFHTLLSKEFVSNQLAFFKLI